MRGLPSVYFVFDMRSVLSSVPDWPLAVRRRAGRRVVRRVRRYNSTTPPPPPPLPHSLVPPYPRSTCSDRAAHRVARHCLCAHRVLCCSAVASGAVSDSVEWAGQGRRGADVAAQRARARTEPVRFLLCPRCVAVPSPASLPLPLPSPSHLLSAVLSAL